MTVSFAEAHARARARRTVELLRARSNVESFVEHALRHEKTGRQLTNAPHHLEWQAFLRENRFAVLIAPVEHAKTQQVAIGATLHKLGNDPTLRLAIVSNTVGQASKLLTAIRTHIDTNEHVREVFPTLRRSESEGDPWHSTSLTVERGTIAKDPSLQALGVNSAILGSRLDGIIVDDVLDAENTGTPEQIEKVVNWFDSSVYSRLTDGGFCWVIGTPWSTADLLHTLSKRPGWASRRYSAVLNPNDPPEHWRPLWPEQFSRERLAETNAGMTPANFARSYLCEVRTDAMSRFREEWIRGCMDLGRGRTFLPRAPVTPGGRPFPCFTGVDLAVGKDSSSDLTCIFTLALDDRGKRIVVDIQSGRWQAPEIILRLKDVHARYNSIVVVEDNGAQNFLLQWAADGGVPVRPFMTGKNKYDEAFGVESLAVEMRSGMWIIPAGASGYNPPPEVGAWVHEMLFYSPDGHTGDRLMASWFAREAARQFGRHFAGHVDALSR